MRRSTKPMPRRPAPARSRSPSTWPTKRRPSRPPTRRPHPPEPTMAARRRRRLSTLQLALLFSFGVHAALMGVRFVDPEGFNRVFKDTPLEVILVNTRSGEAPAQAQAIAQANLQGGGEAETGRATSPLPPA